MLFNYNNFKSTIASSCQVSACQSAAPLPISCKLVQPVIARVEEPVSPVRQSSSCGVTNNPLFPKMPARGSKAVETASAYSVAGGEQKQQLVLTIGFSKNTMNLKHPACIITTICYNSFLCILFHSMYSHRSTSIFS